MEQLGAAAAVIPAAALATQWRPHADCEWPFRQDSDFFYLTGFDEPMRWLCCCRIDRKASATCCSCSPRTRRLRCGPGFRWGGGALWTWDRLGTEGCARPGPSAGSAERKTARVPRRCRSHRLPGGPLCPHIGGIDGAFGLGAATGHLCLHGDNTGHHACHGAWAWWHQRRSCIACGCARSPMSWSVCGRPAASPQKPTSWPDRSPARA